MRPSTDDLSTVFEGAPRFVQRLSDENADSWDELFDRAEVIAAQLPEQEQIELLDGHPRIGADAKSVSALSFREQRYDSDPGPAHLQGRLDRLNDEYERKFGFRFVVFVAGRQRSEIADVMAARMAAPREEELARGLSDVIAIARSRAAVITYSLEEPR